MPKIISISRWRPVYELAQQINELAPWSDMEERELLAVQDPESGLTGYVSVMGNLGEHYAIAVYQGREGLDGFIKMQCAEDQVQPIEIMSVPQLQLSFEERSFLEPEDLFLIRELDLKPRSHAWPMFRSYRPGFAPWFMENDEISFLKVMLEQALVVLSDNEQKERLLTSLAGNKILARVGKKTKNDVIWEYQELPLYPPEDKKLYFSLYPDLVLSAAELPIIKKEILMDLQILLSPVQEKRAQRPVLPYLLLFMDKESGLIVHQEMITGTKGWYAFLEELPEHIIQGLIKLGYRPSKLLLRLAELADLLHPLEKVLGLQIKKVKSMPAVDEFMQGFYERT